MNLLVASILWGSCNSLFTLIEKTNSRHKILASIHLSLFLRLMDHTGKKRNKESSYYSSTNSQGLSLIREDRFAESNRRPDLRYHISLHSIVINNYT